MNMSPFGSLGFKSKASQRPVPRDATLRDFGAGLNLVDSDTSLQTNWSKVIKNMNRDADGGMATRWGTCFKFDVSDVVAGNIIEIFDFGGSFICCMDSGEIAKVNLATGAVAIWNDAIAGALVGSPDGWSTGLTLIDYTDFKNQFVICNGVDKPVIIDTDYTVDYLQDIPTGSNIFTPVGKFCTTAGNYTVIAGVESDPDAVYISAAGTSGTWPGDTAPNDAVSINVATYAPQANSRIRGVSSFRNFLLVHFAGLTVPIQLGVYDADGLHTPQVNDVIPDYGVLSHRFIQPLAQEIVFADERGVYTAKRNLFGQALEGRFLSDKITPAYATASVVSAQYTLLGDEDGAVVVDADLIMLDGEVLTTEDLDLQLSSFCVYNRLENRIMFFMRLGTQTKVFVFSFIDGLKKPSWSIYEDMAFSCGCLAANNKVYFANGPRIYQYGNGIFLNENYQTDLIADADGQWATATDYVIGDVLEHDDVYYICLANHESGVFADDLAALLWEEYTGRAISFDWELPWSDLNARPVKKKLTQIHFDTQGDGNFSFQAYVDNIYQDYLTGENDPAVEMAFVGGDSLGFGGTGTQPFGGGRRTSDERLWGTPVEFKLLKMRMFGTTKRRLKFTTITILYIMGKYHR